MGAAHRLPFVLMGGFFGVTSALAVGPQENARRQPTGFSGANSSKKPTKSCELRWQGLAIGQGEVRLNCDPVTFDNGLGHE